MSTLTEVFPDLPTNQSEQPGLESVDSDVPDLKEATPEGYSSLVEGPPSTAESPQLAAEQFKIPPLSSRDWPEFIMAQFEADELDSGGRPTLRGLRRVVQLLGPVLKSMSKVIRTPDLVGLNKKGIIGQMGLADCDYSSVLQPAVVEHELSILCTRVQSYDKEAYLVEFADCAECYFGNADANAARFPVETASNRAEARCMMRALQLGGISAEEYTLVLPSTASGDGFVSPAQINFIDCLCRDNDVDAAKFVSSGSRQFGDVTVIPWGLAEKMCKKLSLMQNSGNVPEELRGFKENWSNS